MEYTVIALKARVDYWRGVLGPLGLSHWDLEVAIVDEPHGLPSVFAAVHTMNQYDEATMEFSVEGVDSSTEYEIDEKIVHELMHMAARDQWRSVMSLEPAFGTPAWEMFHDRFEHETEGLVDRTARALVAAHHKPWEDVVLFSTTQTEE